LEAVAAEGVELLELEGFSLELGFSVELDFSLELEDSEVLSELFAEPLAELFDASRLSVR
jgi:hypothetical protein